EATRRAPARGGVDHRDRARARRGEITGRNAGRELGGAHEGRGPRAAVPLHDRRGDEVGAGDREGEARTALRGAARGQRRQRRHGIDRGDGEGEGIRDAAPWGRDGQRDGRGGGRGEVAARV